MATQDTETSTPLLVANEARIAIDDIVAIDRLTLSTRGDRVLLVGDVEALFSALTGVSRAARAPDVGVDDLPGEARVTAGSLRVLGRDVGTNAHHRAVGSAPLDPPLPGTWTAEEYIIASARLAGASSNVARDLAPQALAKVGLIRARSRALRTLGLAERRAIVLAQAVVMSPDVVIAESPLSGLESPGVEFVLAAIAGVSAGRGAILSGSKLDPRSPESVIARSATYVAVLVGGEVALEGHPSDLFTGATVYGLTVRSNVDPFRDELASRGIELRGGPQRFSASLPEGASTREIIAAAHAVKAALIELVPLI